MARYAQQLTSVLLAVLVLLEATPGGAPAMARTLPGPAQQCEIAASVVPVTLLALPSERGGTPANPAGFERVPLAPFTMQPVSLLLAKLAVVPTAGPDAAAHARRAWLQILRQRARAPDDPDPL